MNSENRNRSAYIIGLILIGIGLLFLLNTLGIATFRLWYLLSRFWPVILILIGLNIILKKTKLWWLVPILIFILIIGAVLMPGPVLRRFETGSFTFYLNDQNRAVIYSEDRELDSELEKLNLDLKYGANLLDLGRINNNDDLYDINLDYRGERPNIYYNRSNNSAGLQIEQAKKVNIGRGSEKWRVNLTNRVPLDINIRAGAGDIMLDLEDLRVENLDIDAGLGQINIRFPDYNNETEISAGAGNIKLVIPAKTAFRIETNTVLNNINFKEVGLIKVDDDVYQSKNYGEVENLIKIKISTSIGNIKVEHN
ncbi:MAG: DUF5668 domain-containing protein [Halanaerobiales bacterium]